MNKKRLIVLCSIILVFFISFMIWSLNFNKKSSVKLDSNNEVDENLYDESLNINSDLEIDRPEMTNYVDPVTGKNIDVISGREIKN